MSIKNNSDFLFVFQSTLSNPNGDPDQENKPRMDYETSTVLVSDSRRKRDIRDFLKNKGYRIFVDTLSDQKVPMDKMFEHIRDDWLNDKEKMNDLLENNEVLKELWESIFGQKDNYLKVYLDNIKNLKKNKEFTKFNNIFLTEIIKKSLIDIRLFGSAMAVENVTRTYTGPVQISWGYSLHPVELVKSNSITTIMNDDSSTFGKKYKLYYALIAHYGTINKYNAERTGMTEEDRVLFRKALIQSIMFNQTDSKQGQEPLLYLEILYNKEFDGYLGDLRRFLNTRYDDKPIRKLKDLIVDFGKLDSIIKEMKNKGYIEKVIGWMHPLVDKDHLINIPQYEEVDLWEPIKVEA